MPRKFLYLLALVAVSVQAACADEPKPLSLVGTWKILEFHDDGTDKIGRLGVLPRHSDTKFAKLVFTDKECWVVRADGTRDGMRGLTNCAWKSYSINALKTPREIELTGFAGSDGGDAELPYVGIWKVEDKRLLICWNEEGTTTSNGKKRPSEFKSDGAMNLFIAERLSDKPEGKPEKSNAVRK